MNTTARGLARQRELAIRLAPGAGRPRLARQVLMESIVLAFAVGLLGVLVAWWGAVALNKTMDATVVPHSGPDIRALGFTLSVSLATGILFGLAPVFQASRI